MARSANISGQERRGAGILLPAILGVLTVALLAGVLRALAGPHILPDYLTTRYLALILTVHALLALVMGFTGGSRADPSCLWVAGVLSAAVSALGVLAYSRQGLLPPGAILPLALIAGSALLACLGATIARSLNDRPLAPAFIYCVALLVILGAAFVRTGSISGTITRPVNLISLGMLTGQKDEPVPGVPVVLATHDGKRRLYETRANDRGNYVFNGPPPGEYALFIQDSEPVRGSGQWVKSTVKAGSVLSGQGLGTGDVSLPAFRMDQGSPFKDLAEDDPGVLAPGSPGPARLDAPGIPGQY